MKKVQGIWFPDSEQVMIKQLVPVDGRGSFQFQKLAAALGHVKRFRQAIDVGMHIGLWSMHLAKRFKQVDGFEPVPEHLECLHRNMNGIANYKVHACALGDHVGKVGFNFLPGSTGSTQVLHVDQGIDMRMLDDFAFDNVDFIKIDVEHYEYFVIKGAEQTIRRHKPVMIIEQKPIPKPTKPSAKDHYGLEYCAAKKLLESWGAKTKFEMSGDFCLAWP